MLSGREVEDAGRGGGLRDEEGGRKEEIGGRKKEESGVGRRRVAQTLGIWELNSQWV